jgi:hypothetical protein
MMTSTDPAHDHSRALLQVRRDIERLHTLEEALVSFHRRSRARADLWRSLDEADRAFGTACE